jgi:hypothetical protein
VPRNVPFELDQVQLSDKRSPAYKVEIYDVRSGYDTMEDIVVGNALNAVTGPRDFTADVEKVAINEEAGNFADNGIATTNVTLSLTDPNNVFDPWNTIADPTGDGRWLRRDNVVRITEGDSRVDEDKWVLTFTGKIVGQAGIVLSRASGQQGESLITVKAVGREAGFLKYKSTSDVFGIGFTYKQIAEDIAQNDMGLDSDEIDWTTWGQRNSGHEVNQIVDEYPLVGIAQLMFPDGLMPRFDGEGKLSQVIGTITRQPDRIYTDENIFQFFDRPFSALNPVNQVIVLGLDANLSKVQQPDQLIAETDVTTGYFTRSEDIHVDWGEDKTQLVMNARVDVVQSVNAGVNKLGNEEEFTFIDGPTSEGSSGVEISISTGFSAALLVWIAVEYLALAAVPDEVVTFVVGGVTIPVGRIEQAILMIAMMLIMSKIGRGKYAFYGEPFEYVFKEIRAVAKIEGTLAEDINEIEIENHFIQTQSDADDAARDVLFRQQVRGNPRDVAMLHDLRLIPDDIFERESGRQYLIGEISRTLTRNPSSGVAANLTVYEVTEGLPV